MCHYMDEHCIVDAINVESKLICYFRYVFAYFQTHIHPPPHATHGAATPYQTYEHTIPTFLTLYIFGFVYQVVLVYDALRLKNTIQIIAICMYNLALLVYAAVQMDQIHDAVNGLQGQIDARVWIAVKPFLIAIPCVIAVGTLAMSFVARKLYDEFAWTIYKHISADLRMKRRYLTYQVIPEVAPNFAYVLTRAIRSTLHSSNLTSSSSLDSRSNSSLLS